MCGCELCIDSGAVRRHVVLLTQSVDCQLEAKRILREVYFVPF
jgi:hypothetical protein